MQTETVSQPAAAGLQLIPRTAVAAKLGVSVAQCVRVMRANPTFPDPVELARGSYRWLADEVDAWLVNLPRRTTAERAAATTAAATAKQAADRAVVAAAAKKRGVKPASSSRKTSPSASAATI